MYYKYVIVGVLLICSFALGRYSVQKLNSTTVLQTDTHKDQDKHTTTKKVIVQQPNGQTTTTITTDTDTKTITDRLTNSQQTVTQNQRKTLNLSLITTPGIGRQPYYGLSISKEVLGPVTIGLWGLNNGNLGISVGINF